MQGTLGIGKSLSIQEAKIGDTAIWIFFSIIYCQQIAMMQ